MGLALCSGSHIENWHSILRNGLVNASYTKLQVPLCSLHPAHPRGWAGRGQTLESARVPSLPLCLSCQGDPTMLTLVFSCKLHGAAYGKGIYLSPISSISFGYSGKRLPVLPGPACTAQSCLCCPVLPVLPFPLPAWARGGLALCWPKWQHPISIPSHQPLPSQVGTFPHAKDSNPQHFLGFRSCYAHFWGVSRA